MQLCTMGTPANVRTTQVSGPEQVSLRLPCGDLERVVEALASVLADDDLVLLRVVALGRGNDEARVPANGKNSREESNTNEFRVLTKTLDLTFLQVHCTTKLASHSVNWAPLSPDLDHF